MSYLRIISLLAFVGSISCVNVSFGRTSQDGHWGTRHRISFPFAVGGKHYFFGLTDQNSGRYWFIQELKADGTVGSETSTGTWNNYYTRVFPFSIGDKQYIYGIDDEKYWFIQEILPGGRMGTETANGYWKAQPTIIFPFDIGGKQYVYSLTDRDWFIRELLPKGKLGSETDSGSWNNYYTLGFPFSINGKTFFYCLSDNYWFIQELLANGKMGEESDNGHWPSDPTHLHYVPFSIDDRYYFYALTDKSDKTAWFIRQLSPGGKMGPEKASGKWKFYYNLSFAYKINERPFFYGISDYYWFIREILQEPRFPIVNINRERFCSLLAPTAIRTRRQNNNGSCPAGCAGLNAVEEVVTDIENDDNNYLTMTFNNPANPLTSVSTFRVFADATHSTYIDLTAAMRAEIHYSHMTPIRDPTISSEVRSHLRGMDRENDDEAGHLLASSLGGPGVPFNFAPQSPAVNRAVNVAGSVVPQPGWYDVEELLRDYLIEMNGSGYIRWVLAPQYQLLPNSRRPTGFLLSIRFYDDHDRLVNWRNEGAVRSYNFRNVPTVACTDFNHPWWNH